LPTAADLSTTAALSDLETCADAELLGGLSVMERLAKAIVDEVLIMTVTCDSQMTQLSF
jgi:hypothetical protein